MKITPDDVRYVAELAHLELSEYEVTSLQRELDAILSYIDKLNEVQSSPIESLGTGVVGPFDDESRFSVLRVDVPRPCDIAAAALDAAPDPAPPYFRAPKVIDR